MTMVGPGVHELRVRDRGGAYRMVYVVKFEEAVYALHVLEKRSQQTARPDLGLGKDRYADLLRWRREERL